MALTLTRGRPGVVGRLRRLHGRPRRAAFVRRLVDQSRDLVGVELLFGFGQLLLFLVGLLLLFRFLLLLGLLFFFRLLQILGLPLLLELLLELLLVVGRGAGRRKRLGRRRQSRELVCDSIFLRLFRLRRLGLRLLNLRRLRRRRSGRRRLGDGLGLLGFLLGEVGLLLLLGFRLGDLGLGIALLQARELRRRDERRLDRHRIGHELMRAMERDERPAEQQGMADERG